MSNLQKALSEVYLDCNATTPVLPAAAQAVQNAMANIYGNPSSTHITGIRAKHLLESTRQVAKKVIQTQTGHLIFNSGATEGIQTAIVSALCHIKESKSEKPLVFLYGATEHKAVPETMHHWNKALGVNGEVLAVPVDQQGQLDLDFIKKHEGRIGILATMAVNNETGVIQNLEAIEKVLRATDPKALWLVDCVQALGKLDLNLDQMSVDYAPFSGHKLYCPKGTGMLYVREGAPYTSLVVGGGQEHGWRSGTENIPGIAAFGEILKKIDCEDDDCFRCKDTLSDFQKQLIQTLKECFSGIVFNTPFEKSVSTTINFSVKGFPSKEILDLFDAAQIRVSSGSACSSKVTSSFVLDAMGLPKWQSESAIRLSFGPANTQKDIDEACERIRMATKALERSCLLVNPSSEELQRAQAEGLLQLKSGDTCTWIYCSAKEKTCVIIDPVLALCDRIEQFVRCQNYQVVGILETHSHADHELCREMLHDLLHDRIAYSKKETDILGWPQQGMTSVELEGAGPVSAMGLDASTQVLCLQTPGHTSDSRTYMISPVGQKISKEDIDFAFTGDIFLMGGLGRTDFETSDANAFYDTLKLLYKTVSDETILCPAHDYENLFATNFKVEKRSTPIIGRVLDEVPISKAQFVEEKVKLDQEIKEVTGGLMCGSYRHEELDESGVNFTPAQMKDIFTQDKICSFYDVREPHEYALFNDWESLGFRSAPESIPLSRFVQFVHQLKQQGKNTDIVFVCRSGNRSHQAALVLRRFGFPNAKHIAGGIALSLES